MPDLPNRAQHERNIQTALMLLLGDWYQKFKAGASLPWAQMAGEIQRVVAPILAEVYREAYLQMAEEGGLSVDLDTLTDETERAADQFAAVLGQEVAAQSEKRITELNRDYAAGEIDQTELLALAMLVFGTERAKGIAVSEVTRGISTAELAVAALYLEETGEKLIPFWINKPEESLSGPCPVCKPLHNRPESEWPPTLRNGPPAHPRCVCVLDWRAA
jgi:hypothetical protein